MPETPSLLKAPGNACRRKSEPPIRGQIIHDCRAYVSRCVRHQRISGFILFRPGRPQSRSEIAARNALA
jgi:hypothetical protein